MHIRGDRQCHSPGPSIVTSSIRPDTVTQLLDDVQESVWRVPLPSNLRYLSKKDY